MSPLYNPNQYWIERGKKYKEQFEYNKTYRLQEIMLIEYLKNISAFSSVIEIGCGFGRITKLLLSHFPDIEEYLAVDISLHQIKNAKEYVKQAGKRNTDLQFIVSDVRLLEISRRYDLLLASEVFMHILPLDIDAVMRKLCGLSSKHVVNIDWYEEKTPKKVASHNFIHEYQKIYNEIPSVMQVNQIPIVNRRLLFKVNTKQSIFHALKN
jgi:trans-aconitate methyltransferase